MDREQQLALWRPRVGADAAKAIVRAGRATSWAAIFPLGFILNAVGYWTQVERLQVLALPLLLVGGIGMLVTAMLRRRAGRLVRAALCIAPDDNRMGPGDIPPLDELSYQSWLRRLRADPSLPEPQPAYGEAPAWSLIAPPEPILSHSCMRCVFRPKPHDRCGHLNCACARSGHCGWLGPRPRRANISL